MEPRKGFTLAEVLVSMVLTTVIFALTVPMFRNGIKVVGKESGRSDALQNARFGISSIDRDLRVAGVGVVGSQPMLVQVAPNSVTFNADLVTKFETDVGAVYYNPDLSDAAVIALNKTTQIVLPNSAQLYPDTNYTQQGGAPSTAETVSYWVEDDPESNKPDQYVLFRRVNNTPKQMVARGIVLPPGEPMFRYYKTDTLGRPVEIPQLSLPLYHNAKIHGAQGDTGKFALIDSVRIVRVRLSSVYRARGDSVLRAIESGIRIMNSGLLQHSTCGEPPILGVALNFTTSIDPLSVKLTWAKAFDESGGEKDVERYALYRRPAGAMSFGEPFASIAAGLANYEYVDQEVESGQQWVYGVAAQDCTGAFSNIVTTSTVTVPNEE